MSDRRTAAALFILAAGAYGYFFGGGGWNQNVNFALTRAIVEQRSLAIDAFPFSGDVSHFRGHTYPNKAPGVGLLGAVPYAPLFLAESALGIDPGAFIPATINGYLVTWFVCGLLGALIAPALYSYARSRWAVPRPWAIAITLLVTFGTPLFPYATVLFAHVPSAAFVLLAFVLADRRSMFAGFCAGLAALTNYLCVPVIALILVLKMARWRFLLGALPPVLLLGFYQHVTVGAFWRTPMETMESGMRTAGAVYGILGAPSGEALWGITFSRYRGLFFISPLLLLAIGGAIVAWRQRLMRAETIAIGAIFVFFLLFNSTFNGWHGGDAIGPRYLIPTIPLIAVFLFHAIRLPKALWVALGAVSIVLNFAATTVDPLPDTETADPFGSYIFPVLLTGNEQGEHTSVNPDSLIAVASKWSSFNLGEALFGPGSPWSLLPVLLWMVIGAAYFRHSSIKLAMRPVQPV